MISGAVALKELRGFSRRRTTYLLRGVFVGGVVLALSERAGEAPRAGAALAAYATLALGLYGLAFRRLRECPPRA